MYKYIARCIRVLTYASMCVNVNTHNCHKLHDNSLLHTDAITEEQLIVSYTRASNA